MHFENFPDFRILNNGDVSNAFLERNVSSFHAAAKYIQHLPYKRNADKKNLLTVLSDGYGVCSTKHGLLKRLTGENGIRGARLVVGVYAMNARNTRRIESILSENGLDMIPEAHCYLKINDHILDVTREGSSKNDFIDVLFKEYEISPDQIEEYKIALHKKFLKKWLEENSKIPYSLEEIWKIREKCIQELSTQ